MNIRIAAALLLLIPAAASAAAVKPEGFLRVEGDSTLHKWTADAKVLRLDVEPAEGLTPAAAIAAGKVKAMKLVVHVADLTSGEKGLDKKMRKAMKADKFPDVVYDLGAATVAASSGALAASTTGHLTIAGEKREAVMRLAVAPGDGSVAVRGAYELKMSDFGIEPPKLMMGAIKVKDTVTVRFDLNIKTQKEN